MNMQKKLGGLPCQKSAQNGMSTNT